MMMASKAFGQPPVRKVQPLAIKSEPSMSNLSAQALVQAAFQVPFAV